MSKKHHRKKPTKHLKIKVLQDALGEYWDVYEERTTVNGLQIYRGWHYGCTPADEGISPVFSYILTHEIAELIKTNPIHYVYDKTGISLSVIAKMRVKLSINRNFVYRNDQWLLENQDSLLNDSYKTLKNLFNLTKPQVNQHREWLSDLLGIAKCKRLRNTKHDDEMEQWFRNEYENFKGMTVQDLMDKYNISKYLAIKTHDKYQQMNNGASYAETLKIAKNEQAKWLLENKSTLFSSSDTITAIAEKLNKSPSQISRLRKSSRRN
ncbi:hypothetical protein MY149_10700 [Acinetobacter indicus]|nr:hypothetical protein [Acinetobacter indicus]